MKRWIFILLLACSCGPCCPCKDECPCESAEVAQSLFAWSPSGKPYHANACVVKSSDGKCGSGTYIQYGGMTGVLTCQHVVGGKMTATFADGKQLSGDSLSDKDGHDIGWFAVKHPTLVPLNLSAVAPKPGERVEFVSRGGPRSELRHWYGTVQSDGDKLMVDANITPGDSGGGIINSRGEVVGVSTDGQTTAAIKLPSGKTIMSPDPQYAKRIYESNQGWIVYGTAGSPGYGPVRRFVQRVRAKLGNPFCPDGNCPDYSQPSGDGYSDLYPPAEQPEAPDYPQPAPVPSTDVAELRERIDSLEKSLQGPPGPAGKDGRDGKDADPQAIAARIQIPSVEQFADAYHAKYGKQLVADVKAQIPPLYVEVVDPTGKYSSPPQAIRFMDGEGLRLTLDPTQIIIPAQGPN